VQQLGFEEFPRIFVPAYGQFVLLQFQPPGDRFLWPVAILLLDPLTDKLYIRGRESYASIADEDDAQVAALTVQEFQANAETQGGSSLLSQLESMSNTLRTTDRIPLPVRDFPETLNQLFVAFIS
jgi:hypothetical protein